MAINKKKIYSGVDGFFHDILGMYKRTTFSLKILERESEYVLKFAQSNVVLSEEELNLQIANCKSAVRRGQGVQPFLQAMGYVCEVARRNVGISPFIEQIMSAILMQGNYAIQMQTGEGKTLTAAISAVLKCWKGSPCHIVTSNDYLAKRDAESMMSLYNRCGLSVGYVVSGKGQVERKTAYNCDIVYSTSKELLADFLRDRMACDMRNPYAEDISIWKFRGKSVMRGLHAAIIDEADSVLADEATVPLIISISGKSRLLKEAVLMALDFSQTLKEGNDYIVEHSHRDIRVTENGKNKIEDISKNFPIVWSSFERSEYLIKQILMAQHYYHRDVHYVIDDGKVVIVDEKTGRMMHGRSWSGGLHQAIEAKEGIELTDVTESHIQMSFQMFFRLYKDLSGMSGTLQNIERELWSIYGLITVKIPTHVPKKLTIYPEKIFMTADDKWDAVMDDVSDQVLKGRAILVGTRSVRESEVMHERLKTHGIDSTVLNALRHEHEAEIIECAGRKGVVTIATNMAGRGTNILVDQDVLNAGGLHVIATERHESRRVDMQLFGRTARQGQQGSAQMMLSLEDEVMRVFARPWLHQWLKRILFMSFGSRIILVLYIYFQHCAEKARSKLRKRILQQDLTLSKVMSFTKI